MIFADPKPITIRSENYLNHVRGMNCFFCGLPGEVHHVSFHDAGWGTRSGDLTTVCLCRKHHDMAGNDKLLKEEIYEGVIKTMKIWIEKGGIL